VPQETEAAGVLFNGRWQIISSVTRNDLDQKRGRLFLPHVFARHNCNSEPRPYVFTARDRWKLLVSLSKEISFPTSALGHKRTYAVQNRMSALAPKADIRPR